MHERAVTQVISRDDFRNTYKTRKRALVVFFCANQPVSWKLLWHSWTNDWIKAMLSLLQRNHANQGRLLKVRQSRIFPDLPITLIKKRKSGLRTILTGSIQQNISCIQSSAGREARCVASAYISHRSKNVNFCDLETPFRCQLSLMTIRFLSQQPQYNNPHIPFNS